MKGYEVLRFISHNQSIHQISDYVEGSTLELWLQYNDTLGKEQLYKWVNGLIRQIVLFHKYSKKSAYTYVSPYCILISKNGEAHLVNLEAKENQEIQARLTQTRVIRNFFPISEKVNTPLQRDFYSLGRTIQYILSMVEVEELSRKEEKEISRLVRKCLKYQNVYPGLQNTSPEEPNILRKILAIAAVFMLLVCLLL